MECFTVNPHILIVVDYRRPRKHAYKPRMGHYRIGIPVQQAEVVRAASGSHCLAYHAGIRLFSDLPAVHYMSNLHCLPQ